MSQSIRFLGVAVLAWAGVRAVSLGLVPGTDALAFDLPAARPTHPVAPIPATRFAQVEQMTPGGMPGPAELAMTQPSYPAYPGYAPQMAGYPPYGGYIPYPVYVPVPAAYPRQSAPALRPPGYAAQAQPLDYPYAEAANPYFQPVRPIEQWSNGQLALASPVTGRQTTPSFEAPKLRPAGWIDRLQLSTWAMLRSKPGAPGLANGGQLGGSQAGARLLWRFDPHLAASLRTSAPIGSQRGGEAALGIRYQPFASIPVALTAERRQAIGRYNTGRSAFAVFAEGGVYGRSLPLGASLDTYLQAGVVGAKSRDWFVDGSAAATRPVWRNFSAGLGIWGGAQPGLARIDAGPRLSMRVRQGMRVHFDYRQKLAGNAEPGSGGVVTIAGDF